VMIVTTLCDGVYVLVTGSAATMLAPGRVRLMSRISGLCVIGGGVWLALARAR